MGEAAGECRRRSLAKAHVWSLAASLALQCPSNPQDPARSYVSTGRPGRGAVRSDVVAFGFQLSLARLLQCRSVADATVGKPAGRMSLPPIEQRLPWEDTRLILVSAYTSVRSTRHPQDDFFTRTNSPQDTRSNSVAKRDRIDERPGVTLSVPRTKGPDK